MCSGRTPQQIYCLKYAVHYNVGIREAQEANIHNIRAVKMS
jgi:hypothetical protein